MSFILSSIFLLALTTTFVSAQVSLPGKCPDVDAEEDFDLNAFMGLWFEYSKYPSIIEVGMDCGSIEFRNMGGNNVVMISGGISQFTNMFTSLTFNARQSSPGRFRVNFNNNNRRSQPIGNRDNFVIIGTDYTSYALAMSCYEYRDYYHHEVVWILTRDRKPSKRTIKKAKDLMNENGLSKRYLLDYDQEHCPSLNSVTWWPNLYNFV